MKILIGFLLCCFLLYKLPSILTFLNRLVHFLLWKTRDIKKEILNKRHGVVCFRPFGLKMFCGRQGTGKTIGMVWYLEQIRRAYPACHVYTNFAYSGQTGSILSLNDLLKYRNGTDGVVFALDEIQNEFSCLTSKDFPESLLAEITQQRKQRVCILASSQVFMRVAKPLREQCYEVIECRTFAGRWSRLRAYDGDDYCSVVDNPDPKAKFKLPKKWKKSFIQTDALRDLYDTYEKVLRLSRVGFVSKLQS